MLRHPPSLWNLPPGDESAKPHLDKRGNAVIIINRNGAATSGWPSFVGFLKEIRNRHLPGWRFLPFIQIITVYPKICSVIVIGIASPPFGWCG